MIVEKKVVSLTEKLMNVFDQEAEKEDVNGEETLLILKNLLIPLCVTIAQDSPSQEALDQRERWILSVLTEAVEHSFKQRRQQLIAQGAYRLSSSSRSQILDQVSGILSQNNVTPTDGLFILGELVGAMTILHYQDIALSSGEQINQIKREIINTLTEKVDQAAGR